MIGLSLSFCVKDILAGKVTEDDVKVIISGTRACGEMAYEYAIGCYSQSYWTNDPEGGIAIARRLWAAGKVFQPRCYHGGEAPPPPHLRRALAPCDHAATIVLTFPELSLTICEWEVAL